MNDIGGKEKNLEEGDVGYPAVGGDFAHGVVVKEFPDVFLDGCPWPVKEIHTPGTHRKVGNKNMVDVGFVLEKRRLFGFFRVFRNRPSYHYKPVFLLPSPVDLLPEFARFPAVANGMKPAGSGSSFDIGVLLGGNHIAASGGIQKSDCWTSIVSRIHPEPDAGTGNSFWRFFQTYFDERNRSGGTCGIARS